LYRHLLQAQRKFIVYTRMKIVTRFKRRAGWSKALVQPFEIFLGTSWQVAAVSSLTCLILLSSFLHILASLRIVISIERPRCARSHVSDSPIHSHTRELPGGFLSH
jgi:hypothetical protein